MEMAVKATIAKKNLELEKLEKSKKSHLRMISSSTAKLKLKYGEAENQNRLFENLDAKNIRMYETHYPGFCYLRNGLYRKKPKNSVATSQPDPVQHLEKLKSILFTDNELDIQKTMCLHLLGTHVQNKGHIQRKDGRLCSYVKAQMVGNSPQTLQTLQTKTQRVNSFGNYSPSKYDKMLPRYILDVQVLHHEISMTSIKTLNTESEEEIKKKRKLLVPIYINYEIKMIVNSILEALDAVESPKLKALIELSSSPEELRNMLRNEDMIEYMINLAENSLVTSPTSYDFVMAHLMFDKIPEKGTLETVAQVLEVFDDSELKNYLCQIRRAILQRHIDLVNSKVISGKKLEIQEKTLIGNSKNPNNNANSNWKNTSNPNTVITKENNQEEEFEKFKDFESENGNKKDSGRKCKIDPRKVSIISERLSVEKDDHSSNTYNSEEGSVLDSKESYSFNRYRTEGIEPNKWNLFGLTNSQRILLGLKIASLKCKPINMHQFEGKKKINLSAIINPIVRPHVTDIDYKQHSPENNLSNFSLEERQTRKSPSKIKEFQMTDLKNFNQSLLANLRLEISEIENKKRVSKFMEQII